MEKKETNKIIIAIIAIAVVIAIVGSSTFAYWYWASNTYQQTNVSATVLENGGISMTIYPTTTQTNVLYPVSRTNCANADIEGTALVIVKNYTDILARPQFYLKLQILNKGGTNITANTTTENDENGTKLTYAEYIHFAVVDSSNTNTGTTCANAKRYGNFTSTQTKQDFGTGTTVSGWYNSPVITSLTSTGNEELPTRFPILPSTDNTSMTFDVPAASKCYESNETTEASSYTTRQACVNAGKKWLTRVEHTFNFWAWIDSSYKFTNTGTSVTDPLQDAKITVSWSDSSGVKQITGS